MLYHRYRCVFIHQRKAAGTSIIVSFGVKSKQPEWHLFNDGTVSGEWRQRSELAPEYCVFADGRLAPDYLLRVEHLAEDFAKLCELIGMPAKRLPKLNSTERGAYQDYFDEETRELFARQFHKDIEGLGYDFSGAVDHARLAGKVLV